MLARNHQFEFATLPNAYSRLLTPPAPHVRLWHKGCIGQRQADVRYTRGFEHHIRKSLCRSLTLSGHFRRSLNMEMKSGQ